MHLSKAIRDERLWFSCIKEKLHEDRISKEKCAWQSDENPTLHIRIFLITKDTCIWHEYLRGKIKYTRDIHNHLENWIDSIKYFSLMVSVIFAIQNITNSRVKTTRVFYVLGIDKTEGWSENFRFEGRNKISELAWLC